ncbi:Down syndrome cell adhesion molecule-like protein Dscam2 [Centruroides sculpturatus]|uniref:Down syndrome cell adhesion molecule-like protein Dscam2 n=1 Tax=Centruroides sculpturatus TaxID=218467 RepID=UPI000C6DFA34|nr:Down syndrome cell adhesion molecule-like protein Dscam2 [Centruroides sculpturatus]
MATEQCEEAIHAKAIYPFYRYHYCQVILFYPPISPTLMLVSTTATSIHLKWNYSDKEDSPVTGYFLYHMKQHGTWEERQVPSHQTTYTFHDLSCGTHHQFYIIAFNTVGKGKPSDVIGIKTQGSDPPISPTLMLVSTTATSIHLKWNYSDKEDSPVTGYFLYHMKQHGTWEERQVPSHQTTYTFHDLSCGTHHQFYIIAFNTVGKGKPSDVIGIKTQGSGMDFILLFY